MMSPYVRIARAALLLAPLMAAACVSSGQQPRGRPLPPPPAAAPATPPPVANVPGWEDGPVAAGNWSYVRDGKWTLARFIAPDNSLQAWVRCDTATRTVAIGRRGAVRPDMMTIRTSFGAAQWPTVPASAGAPGFEAQRAASDPALDWLAFSRGRFTLELPGMAPLVVPAWAEPVRVIEDCRA
ncbi:MAG: hypothetical protein ABW184_14440 [Sphingobium sp.]